MSPLEKQNTIDKVSKWSAVTIHWDPKKRKRKKEQKKMKEESYEICFQFVFR